MRRFLRRAAKRLLRVLASRRVSRLPEDRITYRINKIERRASERTHDALAPTQRRVARLSQEGPLSVDEIRLPRKHVVFLDSFLDRDAGGASGRLARLRIGLDAEARPSSSDGVSVWIERNRKPEPEPVSDVESLSRIIARLAHPETLALSQERYRRLMRGGTASIDAQRPCDALAVLNALKSHGRTDVLVMLTIDGRDDHDGESAGFWRHRAVPETLRRQLDQTMRVTERLALQGASVWLFTDQDAMDRCFQRHSDWMERGLEPEIHVLQSEDEALTPALFAQAYVDRIAVILDRHEAISGARDGARSSNEEDRHRREAPGAVPRLRVPV